MLLSGKIIIFLIFLVYVVLSKDKVSLDTNLTFHLGDVNLSKNVLA